jgi:SHS2 domain-containing protein
MDRPPFETVPHTADIGLLIRGRDAGELLFHAAQALNSILFFETPTGCELGRLVEVESPDFDTLLIDWLNELLYLFSGEGLVFSTFDVREVTETRAAVLCRGERYNPARHDLARDVKAATYHMAGVRATPAGLEARVILDV